MAIREIVTRKAKILADQDPGRKHDQGKDRWDLLPFKAARAIVRVITHGAAKYAPENWRKVLAVEGGPDRYFAAAMRHLSAWRLGEINDQESGLPHLAHAAVCCIFLLDTSLE